MASGSLSELLDEDFSACCGGSGSELLDDFRDFLRAFSGDGDPRPLTEGTSSSPSSSSAELLELARSSLTAAFSGLLDVLRCRLFFWFSVLLDDL